MGERRHHEKSNSSLAITVYSIKGTDIRTSLFYAALLLLISFRPEQSGLREPPLLPTSAHCLLFHLESPSGCMLSIFCHANIVHPDTGEHFKSILS